MLRLHGNPLVDDEQTFIPLEVVHVSDGADEFGERFASYRARARMWTPQGEVYIMEVPVEYCSTDRDEGALQAIAFMENMLYNMGVLHRALERRTIRVKGLGAYGSAFAFQTYDESLKGYREE